MGSSSLTGDCLTTHYTLLCINDPGVVVNNSSVIAQYSLDLS